jgi:pyridoxine/pyridoxamine 5'-phosphate oxidase
MISRGKSISQVFQRYLSSSILSHKKMDTDIATMRVDYKLDVRLDAEDLAEKDPMSLFETWFTEAKNCEKIEEPNAMTLATCTKYFDCTSSSNILTQ